MRSSEQFGERCLVIEYIAIVEGALAFPTYEKETFDFRASLPLTSRKTLFRCSDSTRPRVQPSPLWFSARPFVPPSRPRRERGNCRRLSGIRDRTGGIGRSFYGGLIIIAVGVTNRTCDLRRRGRSL